jgi:hypothetical protein
MGGINMRRALIIIAVLVVAILVFIGYSGIFYNVTITKREIGPFTMILKKHTGSYYKTGPVFDMVETALKKKIDTKKLKAVGLYYDDPAKVKKEQLRSECGFIVEKIDLEKIGALEDGFLMKDFKKTRCAVGEFPFKTFLSYMIGPSKAYPKLTEFSKGKTFSAEFGMEIYDTQSNIIQYCMPIKETE